MRHKISDDRPAPAHGLGARGQRRRSLVSLAVLLSLAVPLSACSQADETGEPLENPIEDEIERGDRTVRLSVVADGMTAPNWGEPAPGCRDGLLYVTDQTGIVWEVNLAEGSKDVFLDVRERLIDLNEAYDERGLLGLAFHPEFCRNGRFYTYESHPVDDEADFSTMPEDGRPDHQSVLAEWTVSEPRDPESRPDPASAREILRIDQPQTNHNGGALVFGPDDFLYVSLGDGGAADDQGEGHAADGNSQTPSNILGTIIRIDVDGSNAANGRYGIPEDNPFVDDPDKLDEIFAWGLRNAWRISFDRRTGELYAGDVGQRDIEEVDVIRAGGNYGWRRREGTFEFHPRGEDKPGYVTASDRRAPELIAPIAQYDHDDGSSVIGGFVYRGDRIPELQGVYVFGEYNGRLFYLDPAQERDGDASTRLRTIREFRFDGEGLAGRLVLGFGEDAAGELYVLANETGGPGGETGVVLKIEGPGE